MVSGYCPFGAQDQDATVAACQSMVIMPTCLVPCTPQLLVVILWQIDVPALAHKRYGYALSQSIAAAMVYNGGHICVHPQLLVTCKNWPQRYARTCGVLWVQTPLTSKALGLELNISNLRSLTAD